MVPDSYTIIPEMIPTFNFGFEYKGFDARMIVNAYLYLLRKKHQLYPKRNKRAFLYQLTISTISCN